LVEKADEHPVNSKLSKLTTTRQRREENDCIEFIPENKGSG
jgi:hypothetical protein